MTRPVAMRKIQAGEYVTLDGTYIVRSFEAMTECERHACHSCQVEGSGHSYTEWEIVDSDGREVRDGFATKREAVAWVTRLTAASK